MDTKRPIYINITAITVVKIILILIIFVFLFAIYKILLMLFVALILSSALDPWVDWLQNKKIPRSIGVIIIYIIMFSVVASVVYLIIPPIREQISELSATFPAALDKVLSSAEGLRNYFIEHGYLDNLKDQLSNFSGSFGNAAISAVNTVKGLFLGIFTFFLILVMTFYMSVEENALKKIIFSIAPPKYQVYIMGLINRMQKKIGLWLRGQLILSFIIFLFTYTGLLILGVKYALVLASIAGLTEFVPYLGPMLAAIPAIFLAFTQAPSLALFVAALYYIIQLVENHIIVPKLMQKVVGLNPIISIAVILIGLEVAGPIGGIMSIPVTTAIKVYIDDVFENRITVDEECLEKKVQKNE